MSAKVEEVEVEPQEPEGYFWWSRDPGVSVLAVVPLWVVYELLRATLAPHERNGAEALVTDAVRLLGPRALTILRMSLGAIVVISLISVLRRRVPFGRVAIVAAFEGAVCGLLLGPVTQGLTLFLFERGVLQIDSQLTVDIVGSLGAGIFEEAVFRLGMLSLIGVLLGRAAETFAMHRATGAVLAVLISAVAFSWFHHLGPGGEAFEWGVFTFRAVAGVVLGTLFVFRGFAVVVYAHAVYDIYYYVAQVHG